MDRGTWSRLIEFEKEFSRRGEILSRGKIQDVMGCTMAQARLLDWGIKNKDIIRHKPVSLSTENGERVLFLFDIHIPFQDDSAIEAALSYGDEYQPTMIIIGGDLLDFYQCSSFIKNPKKKSVDAELKQCRQFLADLRKRFPLAKIIFKEGNHEQRFEKYVMQNASAIYSLVDDLIIHKLALNELDISYQIDHFRVGKLWVLHGHEKPAGGDPEYICNVVFRSVLDHFIVGHHHRTQEKPFKRIDQSLFYGGACGYLGGIMDYAKLNRWNQGFATADFQPNGYFRCKLHKIEAGEVY